MTLPANIANKDETIITDIIDCDLPLLLSKEAMKKAEVKLDFVNDKVDYSVVMLIYFSPQVDITLYL